MSNSRQPYYVTTSIPYLNGEPHIGFALEITQADVLARYHRFMGRDVYFTTGSDEHGVKIYTTAQERGMTAQEMVDENMKKFYALKEALNLTFDTFIRTTSDKHKQGAQTLWKAIDAAGDLYKDSYGGHYCVGCEAFLSDKDMDEHKHCLIHKKPAEWIEEENYFFKLSRYQEELAQKIESDEIRIIPQSRKNEILTLIQSGLKDVSFSRPKSVLPWGVDVPNDEDHAMYVWCDALSNYITALGYGSANDEAFKKYWHDTTHIIGKDILRFHAAIWPGMLMSAGLPSPKCIYVHGFITSDGQKMSKSIGNVVDPFGYIEEFGADPLRYYLMSEIPTTDDGDFTRERFINTYNTDLAHRLGNLVNRVIVMTHKFCDGKVPDGLCHEECGGEINRVVNDYHVGFKTFNLRAALQSVMSLADHANKYIDENKPWVLAKEGKMEELRGGIRTLLEMVAHIGALLHPFMPEKAGNLLAAFSEDVAHESFTATELLTPGMEVKKIPPLFPVIEDK